MPVSCAVKAKLNASHGLDRPLYVRYFNCMWGVLHVDFGVPTPTPIWGQMINTGMNFMYFYWHMAVFPTAALAITVLATTLFGDGSRDALDPTLKGR